jgi:hypothetical protein
MHQGAKKSACRNTPPVKCATFKTSDNASMPAFTTIRYFGHVSRWPGHRLRSAGDRQLTASAAGSAILSAR